MEASWGGASLVLSCPCTHGWTAGLCLGCPSRKWGLEAIRRGSRGGLGRGMGVWPISGLVLVLTTVLFLSGGPGGLQVLAEPAVRACRGGMQGPGAEGICRTSLRPVWVGVCCTVFSFRNVAVGFGPLSPGEGVHQRKWEGCVPHFLLRGLKPLHRHFIPRHSSCGGVGMGSQGLDPGTCPPHCGGCCSYRLTEVGRWVSGYLQGGAGTDPHGGLPSTPGMSGQVGSGQPVRDGQEGWAPARVAFGVFAVPPAPGLLGRSPAPAARLQGVPSVRGEV